MLGPLLWLAASATLCSAYESAAGAAGLVKIRQLDIQHAHPVKVHGDPGKTPPIHRTKPSRKPFVTLRNGLLVLDDPKGTPFRFASMNAPELLTGEPFEVEDTMKTLAGFGRAVTRTYTLTINGTGPSANTVAHINCWDEKKGDWEYQEGMFRKMDNVLAEADKNDVRLIIPLINQAYGSPDSNWVGNWVDLIICRKNRTMDYRTARNTTDFWTDREMIDSQYRKWQKIRRRPHNPWLADWYSNELQYSIKGNFPPPGIWTCEIAKHIKSLAPRTLVIDGSLARVERVEDYYAEGALKCPEVDIFDYHYYGSGDTLRVQNDTAYVKSFNKAFVVAEYGFVREMDVYAQFLAAADKAGTIGSMIWSLRPHSALGGFKTHREDAENAAYHAPGWPNPLVHSPSPKPVNWDEKEYPIIKMIRKASYRINKERLPKLHPIPTAPYVWSNKNATISWRGAAWALKYEAWMAPSSIFGRDWKRIGVNITDAVDEGQAVFTLPPDSRGLVKMRGISVEGVNGEWSNAVKI